MRCRCFLAVLLLSSVFVSLAEANARRLGWRHHTTFQTIAATAEVKLGVDLGASVWYDGLLSIDVAYTGCYTGE